MTSPGPATQCWPSWGWPWPRGRVTRRRPPWPIPPPASWWARWARPRYRVQELAEARNPGHDDTARKSVPFADLSDLADKLRKETKSIVLTNGCFDLLHAGHLDLFSRSRRHGDVLMVAIDDDASVRRLKGAGRPVIGQQERIRTLCALDSIDYVTVFATEDLEALLEAVRPDILTKGSNYTDDEVAGRRTVEKNGGRVVRGPGCRGSFHDQNHQQHQKGVVSIHRAPHLLCSRAIEVRKKYVCMPGASHLRHPVNAYGARV